MCALQRRPDRQGAPDGRGRRPPRRHRRRGSRAARRSEASGGLSGGRLDHHRPRRLGGWRGRPRPPRRARPSRSLAELLGCRVRRRGRPSSNPERAPCRGAFLLSHALVPGSRPSATASLSRAYEDDAEATLDGGPLRRRGAAAAGPVGGRGLPDAEALEDLHHRAHRACFVANSVNFPVAVEPR